MNSISVSVGDTVAEILRQHGAAGVPPRVALQICSGNPKAGNHGLNHTGRDVARLVSLGLQPIKVGTRWVVPAHQIARWASGELTPRRIDLRTREGRKTKAKAQAQQAAAAKEVRHGG